MILATALPLLAAGVVAGCNTGPVTGASATGSVGTDAGPDAGSVRPDAGSVVPDAGSVVPDAGSVVPDAGSVVPDAGSPDAGSGSPDGGATCLGSSASVASLTAHNTSANGAYDQSNFSANFGTTSWVSQSGTTLAVDPTKEDVSLNPVTPGHVSNVDVHTLIPSRPDLRWFAHIVPWFRLGGGGGHIDIGLNNDSASYVQSMVEDMKNRGFNGLIVDWYGQGSYEDSVTLLIQQYLASVPNNNFKFIIQMDKGIKNLSQSVLQTQIVYVQSQYFGDPNYELEGGEPILMFFGVDTAIGSSGMQAAKSNTGGHMVWVTQGSGTLSESWVDQSFDWTHDFHSGDSTSDPYNLGGVAGYYAAVQSSTKKAFGSMAVGFNGMLTKSVGWSQGKYLPRGHGACLVQWAEKINSVIPANVTRMQWATWSDWEEGSQIEGGVENDIAVSAAVNGASLSWTIAGGTGDDSTLDHYEIYVSRDGVTANDLGAVPAGTQSFNLGGLGCLASGVSYSAYVDAVGKANIRNHLSAPATFVAP